MANLVTPVNMLRPVEQRIIDFKGLNRQTIIEEGEMSDMKNLTADSYPVLTQRRPRAIIDLPADVKRPVRLLKRYGKLGMIAIDNEDNVQFYFDGVKYPEVAELTPLTTQTRAVAINTKMCFFPQKTYIEIHQSAQGIVVENPGHLEASIHVTNQQIDKQTNGTLRIELPSDPGFKYDDAINMVGTLTVSSGSATSAYPVNVSCIVEEFDGGNGLIIPQNTFLEYISWQDLYFTGDITRTMPGLDYVVEWNNRLWGACNEDNTIYASKLGDPTNWQYFQGVGLDSFYAQQGTDEAFTGIAEYSGHIIFFKPDSMCRIYGSAPSNFQVTNTKCYGVEDGSSRSVVTINDTVFYKSSIGIMAYQGGTPYCISNNFNREFKNVIAGTEGQKYYASCLFKSENGSESALMVFDIRSGLWHKEDSLRFVSTCMIDNRLYYTSVSGDLQYCDTDIFCDPYLMVGTEIMDGAAGTVNPAEPTESDEDIEWMAVFGPFDEYIEEHKIYSKLALRVVAKGACSMKVYMSLDEGEWEQVENIPEVSTKGDFIPIVPRRCDRYSVKIEGEGRCEIKSLTRRVRRGSFGRI